MRKRAASRVVPAAAKASKAAKVQEKKEDVPWQPALAAIEEISGITKTCKEMWLSAVPHSRPPADQEPHLYQRQVLDSIEETLEETLAQRQSDVQQAEQHIAELEAEKQLNETDVTAASQVVAERKEAWDKAKALYKEEAAVAAAHADLTDKKTKEDSLVDERAAAEKQLQELRQVMAEDWTPLKEGSAALTGKNWRAGRKAAERVTEMLRLAGAPDSMVQAVPVSLSQKVAERREFALLTIEHAEKTLSNCEAVLAARLASFDEEATTRAAASAAAKEAWQTAKAARQELWQASIDTENSWAEAQSRVLECNRKEKGFAHRSEDLIKGQKQLLAALQKTQGVLAAFKSWRAPAAAAAAAAGEEGEAATEEPAAAAAEGAAAPEGPSDAAGAEQATPAAGA